MKRKGKKLKIRWFRVGVAVSFPVLIIGSLISLISLINKDKDDARSIINTVMTAGTTEINSDTAGESLTGDPATSFVVYPEKTKNTEIFSGDYDAKNALLMCVDDNEIIAYKNMSTKMYPASLTKVMTLVVAVENIEDLSDTVLITEDMIYPLLQLDASMAGFQPGETPALMDVLYGMILPSGADAALAAAVYVSGSEEAFVELMNKKAGELGLRNTHFTNVTGLHHEEHYSTAEDMAVILEYAIRNETCRKVLEKYEYTMPPTEHHPDGLTFTSTIFSRMYGNEMPGVTVRGGKTGYTDQAANCIESYAEIGGKTYILVLCGASTRWNTIYDTLSAYSVYCTGGEAYIPPQ